MTRVTGTVPKHLAAFDSNTAEVINLEVGYALAKPRAQRLLRSLNKSAIVLLVACWEAFLEDLAIAGFDAVLKDSDSPHRFPAKVLSLAARELRTSADERRVWELAGDGWRQVMERHRDAILRRFIATWNTPKPEQIDSLFSDLLGISRLTEEWHWSGTTQAAARARISSLVSLRGEIAHRVVASQVVHRKHLDAAGHLVSRLAVKSSNAVRRHVHSLTGAYPWVETTYGGKPA